IDPAGAREDAGWFDEYARALEAEYAAWCGRADPLRIACLDDATEDLRAAVSRADRHYWPRLRALDRCGTASREVDLGGISSGGRVRLSPEGRKLLVVAGGHAPVIQELARSDGRRLDLAVPLRWLPDGSIVGFNRAGRLELAAPTARRRRQLVPSGP